MASAVGRTARTHWWSPKLIQSFRDWFLRSSPELIQCNALNCRRELAAVISSPFAVRSRPEAEDNRYDWHSQSNLRTNSDHSIELFVKLWVFSKFKFNNMCLRPLVWHRRGRCKSTLRLSSRMSLSYGLVLLVATKAQITLYECTECASYEWAVKAGKERHIERIERNERIGLLSVRWEWVRLTRVFASLSDRSDSTEETDIRNSEQSLALVLTQHSIIDKSNTNSEVMAALTTFCLMSAIWHVSDGWQVNRWSTPIGDLSGQQTSAYEAIWWLGNRENSFKLHS